jgi:NADPH-dependent 2,4-dienoyl-CoA reductase/sulfur reductase-like enzyme
MTERWTQPPKVAVVGGGLAGLAAGCALAESGFRVSLFLILGAGRHPTNTRVRAKW